VLGGRSRARGGVGGTRARGKGYQREQRREKYARVPSAVDQKPWRLNALGPTNTSVLRSRRDARPPGALRPSDTSAPRDSQRETQRELRVLAILALARKAHLAPLIRRPVRRRLARTARSAGVDLVAELQCCFACRRYEILA
jgi:hypothetical protein